MTAQIVQGLGNTVNPDVSGRQRKPTVLPGFFKEKLHERIDELVAMYERGDPLWILGEDSLTSTFGDDITVRITIRERLP